MSHAPELCELARRYLAHLLAGEREQAASAIMRAVKDDGLHVRDVYLDVFQPAQYEVGRLWQTNKITVAHEHYCTASTQQIMARLYPYVFAEAGEHDRRGILVACCVGRELHELGMRMVADFFEMQGWDTHYLGANTPRRAVLDAVFERKADLLAVSVTMTYHVHLAEELVREARDTVPVLVGGQPFVVDTSLWQRIGANGFALDARDAVAMGNELAAGS